MERNIFAKPVIEFTTLDKINDAQTLRMSDIMDEILNQAAAEISEKIEKEFSVHLDYRVDEY